MMPSRNAAVRSATPSRTVVVSLFSPLACYWRPPSLAEGVISRPTSRLQCTDLAIRSCSQQGLVDFVRAVFCGPLRAMCRFRTLGMPFPILLESG